MSRHAARTKTRLARGEKPVGSSVAAATRPNGSESYRNLSAATQAQQPDSAEKHRRIGVVIVAIFLVAFAGAIIWLNGSVERVPLRPTGGSEFAKATVDEVLQSDTGLSDEGEMQGNQTVRLTITSGTYEGQTVEATSPYSNNSGAYCEPGLKVIVLVNQSTDGSLVATVFNYDRGLGLWILVALFLGLLCLVGGRAGVLSGLGLAFTFACIFLLFLPLVYEGVSPFLATVLVVVLVTAVGMYLIGGLSYKTLCSAVGTISGVLVAGLVAWAFSGICHISGLNVEEIETLAYVGQNSKLDVAGLLFAGILISSLGAVMDISMSVTSTICELHTRMPNLGFRALFDSGMTVGRDMMGTMTHTLILAFAGGAINSIVIIYAYSMPYLEFMNMYSIGIEILRGLSGSIGIILCVPLVSAFTSYCLTRS